MFTIAELANRFQIPFLISVCENHLFNCLEIQIEKRIIFAVVHGFNNLKVYYVSQGYLKVISRLFLHLSEHFCTKKLCKLKLSKNKLAITIKYNGKLDNVALHMALGIWDINALYATPLL